MTRAFSYYAKAPIRTALPILAGIAFALTLILEMLGRRSVTDAFRYLIDQPLFFLFNLLIVLATLSLCLLVRRRMTMLLLLTGAWLALGVSNFIVLSYRSSPLSAIDRLIVRSALGMADVYFTVVQLILIGLLTAAFLAVLVLLYIKCPKCSVCYRKSITCVAVFALTAWCILTFTAGASAADYEAGELADAYDDYGFAYCFTQSIVSKGVDMPEEYGEALLDEVFDTLEPPSSDTAVRPNIILVQLESFVPAARLEGITCSEDPTPNFTALIEGGVSGSLRVPHIGGGTANVEFEVLTGMNLDHFGFGEYPYTTVLQERACESLAVDLAQLGYHTHAVHNHTATFYDRHRVYPNLGFETFTPIEMMPPTERNPLGWAKDSALTGEILSAMASTDGADFVFAVTVQGHGKYPEEWSGGIDVSGAGDRAGEYRYYVNQLHETDAFIGELIAALEASGEPCAVVFYGDHQPALPASEAGEASDYLTDYAVWSNVPLDGGDRDLAAYELAAYIQQLLGFGEGAVTRLHQSAFASGEDCSEALRVLEYALLYDDPPVVMPAEMRLGTRDITVENVILRGSTLYIRGCGFNEYSRIRLDGFLRETLLLDETTLAVENIYFGINSVEVVQVAEDGTKLYTAEAAG